MDKIRSWLFIGKYRDTLNLSLLDEFNITAMLQLAELVEHPGITSRYLPVEDGEPLPVEFLEEGIAFIKDQKERGHNILVACGAGISRSAAFSIAALHEIEGMDLLHAFQLVKAVREIALPHPAIWDSLCAYYHVTISWKRLFELPPWGDHE